MVAAETTTDALMSEVQVNGGTEKKNKEVLISLQ